MLNKYALSLIFGICFDSHAPVAQLDRVPDYESGGCRFESCRVYFI